MFRQYLGTRTQLLQTTKHILSIRWQKKGTYRIEAPHHKIPWSPISLHRQPRCSNVYGLMDTGAGFSFGPRKYLAHNLSCDCKDCRKLIMSSQVNTSDSKSEKHWGIFHLSQRFRLHPPIISCTVRSEGWNYIRKIPKTRNVRSPNISNKMAFQGPACNRWRFGYSSAYRWSLARGSSRIEAVEQYRINLNRRLALPIYRSGDESPMLLVLYILGEPSSALSRDLGCRSIGPAISSVGNYLDAKIDAYDA